jgi:hypothetical protein
MAHEPNRMRIRSASETLRVQEQGNPSCEQRFDFLSVPRRNKQLRSSNYDGIEAINMYPEGLMGILWPLVSFSLISSSPTIARNVTNQSW